MEFFQSFQRLFSFRRDRSPKGLDRLRALSPMSRNTMTSKSVQISHRSSYFVNGSVSKKNYITSTKSSVNGTCSPLVGGARTPLRSSSCTRPLRGTPTRPSRTNTAVTSSPRKASAPAKLINAIGGSLDSLPDSITVRRKISTPVRSYAQNRNYEVLNKPNNNSTKRTSSVNEPITSKKKFSAPAKLQEHNTYRISKDHTTTSSHTSGSSGSKDSSVGQAAAGTEGVKAKRGIYAFPEVQPLPTLKEEKKSKGKSKKMSSREAPTEDTVAAEQYSSAKTSSTFYAAESTEKGGAPEAGENTAIDDCIPGGEGTTNSHDIAFVEKKNDLEKMVSDLIKNNESKKQEIAALKMEINRLKEAARERTQQASPSESPKEIRRPPLGREESTKEETTTTAKEDLDIGKLMARIDSLTKDNQLLRDQLQQLGVTMDSSPLSDQQKEMILSRVSALSQSGIGENLSLMGCEREWDNKSSSSISEISVACLQGRIQQMEETHYSTNEELQATLQELEDVREQIAECQMEIQQLQEEKQVILESLTQQTEKLNEARNNNDTLNLMLIQQSENSQDVSQCEKTQRLMELLKSVQEDKELVQITKEEFEHQMQVSKEAEEHFHRETQLIRDRMKLLESMVESANNDKKTVEGQLLEAQEIIKATQKESDRLKTALSTAKEKITEMEAAVISGEKSELADVLERVCAEKEASEREVGRLQRKVNHLMCENERLKEQVGALQENLRVTRNNAKTNLDDVEWRRTQLDERRRELEIEMESLKAAAAEAQINCQRHLEDKRDLKSTLSETQKKLAEANERQMETDRSLKEERSRFSQQKEEWDQFQKDLLTSVRVANDFKMETQRNMEKVEQENQSLKEKLKQLETDMEKAKVTSLLPSSSSSLTAIGGSDRRVYKGLIANGEGSLNDRRNNPRPLARGDSRVKSLIESIECATKQTRAGSRSSSTSSIASNASDNITIKTQLRRVDAEGVLRNLPLTLSSISPLKESVNNSSTSPLRALNCNSITDSLSSTYLNKNQNSTNLPDTVKMSQLSNEKNSTVRFGTGLVDPVNKPVSILANKIEPIRRNSYGQMSVDKKDPLAALSQSGGSKRNALLKWCQNKTLGYSNVDITNFSSSWNDGLALCALLDTYMPEKINYASLNLADKRKNFEVAFFAAESIGISTILDVHDMITLERPSWQSVFNYVTSIYSHFET